MTNVPATKPLHTVPILALRRQARSSSASDQCGQAEVDRFQEGVTEPLNEAGVGHQVGLQVGIPQAVRPAPTGGHVPGRGEAIGSVAEVHTSLGSQALQSVQIPHPLVASRMRDNERQAGILQSPHQLDGQFNALARYDTGGLQDQPGARREPQLRSQVGVERIRRRRRGLEVKDVGQDPGRQPAPLRQCLLGQAADDQAADGGQVRRETPLATEARFLPGNGPLL